MFFGLRCLWSWMSWSSIKTRRCSGEKQPAGSSLKRTWRRKRTAGGNHTSPRCRSAVCWSWGRPSLTVRTCSNLHKTLFGKCQVSCNILYCNIITWPILQCDLLWYTLVLNYFLYKYFTKGIFLLKMNLLFNCTSEKWAIMWIMDQI